VTTPCETVVLQSTGDAITVACDEFTLSLGGDEYTLSLAEGPPGVQGPPGTDGGATQEFIAADAVSGHRVVYVTASGQCAYPDITQAAHVRALAGVTDAAASAGATVAVRQRGLISHSGWTWTPGELVFCGVGGVPTQTQPVPHARAIGVATSATAIWLDLSPLIVLV
jgi:hypothetical protein